MRYNKRSELLTTSPILMWLKMVTLVTAIYVIDVASATVFSDNSVRVNSTVHIAHGISITPTEEICSRCRNHCQLADGEGISCSIIIAIGRSHEADYPCTT
jgi:hypothetical protein